MKYTRTEDSKIRAELLSLERELAGRSGSWPLADEQPTGMLGKVLDHWGEIPSLNLKREYLTPCGHKLAVDPNYLLVEIAQLNAAHSKKAVECMRLKRALKRSQSETVIASLAGIALLVITILGMRL